MRITRLLLQAYGHFTELALDFPTPHGLHVVLGANEAGKSTALAAIGDALFGFPHVSPAAWRHAPRDLRVGLTLRREDGAERSFQRRKGREPTLLDETGAPVSDAALAQFLGSLTRERFERVFGLDDEGLRAGGQLILEGGGDLGESVLEAETGLAGSRDALRRLERDAASLWGDRKGARAVWQSLGRFEALRRGLPANTVRAAEHEARSAELVELDRDAAAARARAAALEAERTRLVRIRATTPVRTRLVALLDERAALGERLGLPADADRQRADALRRLAQATTDGERAAVARRIAAEALATVRPDEAVLAEAAAIEAVVRDLSRVESLRSTIGGLEEGASAHLAAMGRAGRALGCAGEPDRIVAPSLALRRRARAMLPDGAALFERVRRAADAVAERRDGLPEASGLPGEDDEDGDGRVAALSGAADAVRAAGPVADELGSARMALADALDAVAGLVARLPRFGAAAAGAPAGLDELLGLRLPLPADEAAAGAALIAAETAAADAARALAERERDARRAADACRVAAELAGPLPDADAVAAARLERDRSFEALVAGTAGPEPVRRLVRDADALADRRVLEAGRVAERDGLRADAARAAVRLDGARRDAAASAARRDEAADRWRVLWREVSPEPAGPDAMRDWRAQHGQVVLAAAAAAQARRRVAERAEQVAQGQTRLDEVLGGEGAGETLGRRLERLDGRLRDERARVAARAERLTRRKALAAELAREEAVLAEALAALDGWRADWSELARHLGLLVPDDRVLAAELLDEWDRFDAARDGWDADRQAAGAARREVARFAGELDRLRALVPGAAAVGGGLAGVVAVLDAALRAAEAARDEVVRLGKALAGHDELIGAAARARDEAADALAGLCALAGVGDEAALGRAIATERRRDELDGSIGEGRRELAAVDDGLSLAALLAEAEAAGVEPDALPGRIAAVAEQLAALGGAVEERAARRAALAAILRGMEERTGAQDLLAMQDEIASMGDGAARYVRLRLAHALLRASIERVRRENQDPLLVEAGGLFRSLTDGRYDGLQADDADGKPVMLARRADGSTCPVARLSEGTLDQLYLALRLASLRRHGAGAERVPLVADDLLASFDDRRARAALAVLQGFGEGNQTILFTHHGHIARMAVEAGASLHHLEVA